MLSLYFNRLRHWNSHINLTGPGSEADLVAEHLPDSFALAAVLTTPCRVVDVGSGGGLPAIPFAVLCPNCRVTLVEPRAKRVAFLRTIVRELGLANVEIRAARVEAIAADPAFDAALSRATFPPAEWLAIGAGLVTPGGRVIVFGTDDGMAGISPPPSATRAYVLADGRRRVLGVFLAQCST